MPSTGYMRKWAQAIPGGISLLAFALLDPVPSDQIGTLTALALGIFPLKMGITGSLEPCPQGTGTQPKFGLICLGHLYWPHLDCLDSCYYCW